MADLTLTADPDRPRPP